MSLSSSPMLTIVTITRDDPSGIAATLGSLRPWLNLPWVEHIVVYAGEMPAGPFESTRMISQSGRGIAGAFNEGLAVARGEWVWFLNGGDRAHEELSPGWLHEWLSRTRADMVVGTLHFDGETAARAQPPLESQRLWIGCWLPHPATLVRIERLRAEKGFSSGMGIAMDYELWFRLLRKRPVMDLVSIPFARFDVNGLSSRPDTIPQARREVAQILWRERGWLVRNLWREVVGVARALAWSALHGRRGPGKERVL